MRYPQIAARVFNTPLLIAPRKLEAILGFLGPRMGLDIEGHPSPKLWFDDGAKPATNEPADLPFVITERGTAIIPVFGALVHRGSLMDDISGLTSYSALSEHLEQALSSADVRQIVLSLDSPGGEAAGAFDFADEIYAARGRGKPIIAIVNEMACSAGYLIASAADRIISTRTAYTGSIGVMTSRLDISKANDRAGVVITMVYAGDRKADGYPYEPMSSDEKDTLTKDVEKLYGLFVSTIARNRNISEDLVRATQAAVFDGQDALERQLIDQVLSYKQALASVEAAAPAVQISAAAPRPRVSRAHREQRAAALIRG